MIPIFSAEEKELAKIADTLYDQSDDDDVKMAELLHELPEDTAHALLTSNLTNAVQAYIYAFNEVPDYALYDLLLLQPSYQLKKGIVLESTDFAKFIFRYDRDHKKFIIGVSDGENIRSSFSGEDALARAKEWAFENNFEFE